VTPHKLGRHADLSTTEVYLHVFDADLWKVIQRRRHPLSETDDA
jgi:site-specific recombinase XerD